MVKIISVEFTWKITPSALSSMRPVIVIVYFLISNWTHWAPSAVTAQQGPGHPIGKWSGLTSRREELRPLFQSQQFCQ